MVARWEGAAQRKPCGSALCLPRKQRKCMLGESKAGRDLCKCCHLTPASLHKNPCTRLKGAVSAKLSRDAISGRIASRTSAVESDGPGLTCIEYQVKQPCAKLLRVSGACLKLFGLFKKFGQTTGRGLLDLPSPPAPPNQKCIHRYPAPARLRHAPATSGGASAEASAKLPKIKAKSESRST